MIYDVFKCVTILHTMQALSTRAIKQLLKGFVKAVLLNPTERTLFVFRTP